MTAVPSPVLGQCRHCGTPIEGGEAYCCNGCAMAAEIMSAAGLDIDEVYTRRTSWQPRPDGLIDGLDRIPVQTRADGLAECSLRVEGIRCASCVWVTERVVEKLPGVREVTVRYGSGRARVVFDPASTSIGAIAGRIAALGYRPVALGDAIRGDVDRDLLLRLGIAAFCAANAMLLAVGVYAGWFTGMDPRFSTLFQWVGLVLATPVVTWSAVPFFRGAWGALRHGYAGMDVPIAIGIAAMYAHGVYATVIHEDAYFDSLSMLVMLLLVGRVLEARGRRSASEAAEALGASLPRSARRVTASGGVESVSVDTLAAGDHLELGAGEEIAADGTVDSGHAAVRMALLTGESEPIGVGPGDRVVAGAVVIDGSLRVRVDAVGGEMLVERMAEELRRATDRPAAGSRVDRLAPWFVAATLGAAAATFASWTATNGVSVAIHPTVAVLVVACPCALALAEPLAIASGLAAAARRGLLIRNGDALLRLADVDLVALDKTGTVTVGEPAVVTADDAVLRLAAGLSRYSTHPISRAIVAAAGGRGIALPVGVDVRETPGRGLTGRVDGRAIELHAGGPSAVAVHDDRGVVGEITLRDIPREDARRTIDGFRAAGLDVALVTGDRAAVASVIAQVAGIERVEAGLDPHAKARWIDARSAEGRRVLFVGDGLNDGPALANAYVAVAMASGSASSVLVADAIVAEHAIGPVLSGIRAARLTRRAIRGNIARSLTYNVLAVLAASLGYVNPLVAAVLMPLSSTLVVLGATATERRMENRWTR